MSPTVTRNPTTSPLLPPEAPALRRRALSALMVAALAGLAMTAPTLAQDGPDGADEAETEQDPAAGADDPSRETDIAEDNYRRYMELSDRRLERPAFPTATLQPGSSLEKMGKLPEESQKHLRNQLRGIILARGPWTPEERDAPYRFTPSAAAQKDPDLLRREAEAWVELVGEYHEREAATLAGREGGSLAPMAGEPGEEAGVRGMPPTGMAGDPPSGQGQAGPMGAAGAQGAAGGTADSTAQGSPGQQQGQDGQEGQGEPGEGEGQQGEQNARQAGANQERPESRDRPEPGEWEEPSTTDPETLSDEGVAQSASEFLRERGLVDSTAGDTETTNLDGLPDLHPDPGPDPGRWGEDALTLPPPVEVSPQPGNTSPAEALPVLPPTDATQDPGETARGVLTVEELRGVRGVGEPAPGEGDDSAEPPPEEDPEGDPQDD